MAQRPPWRQVCAMWHWALPRWAPRPGAAIVSPSLGSATVGAVRRWGVGVREADGAIYTALVTGVRDYVTKNGFAGVVLGLSGGIASALTLASCGEDRCIRLWAAAANEAK